MWYVIQVTSGQENRVCKLIKSNVSASCEGEGANEILSECFVPLYQAEQKFKGEYRIVNKRLFPGYVIAISQNVSELNRLLRSVSAFTRILGNSETFVPLDRIEMEFIDSFTSKDHRVIETSRAVVEGDVVTVIDGPMLGHESWIKKINRRKGTVEIEVFLFGRTLVTEVGLAAVSKRPSGKSKFKKIE